MADHLRNSTDNDRRGGSTSPDVHQLLQDISSMMRAVSPALEPSFLPPTVLQPSKQGHSNGDTGQRALSPKQSRKSHLRSRVAANFNLEAASQKNRTNGEPSAAVAAQSMNGHSDSHLHSTVKPRVPQLNIGDSDQQEGKKSPESAPKLEVGGDSSAGVDPHLHDGGHFSGGHGNVEELGSAGSSRIPSQDKAMESAFKSKEALESTAGQSHNGKCETKVKFLYLFSMYKATQAV